MRRSAGALLLVLAASLPGRAQPTPPRLHRNLPGDLDLGRLPPVGAATPDPGATGGSPGQGAQGPGVETTPGSEVLQPRSTWEPQVRELDRQTRSPAGATLRYREVFDPAVAPFKRQGAYDAVDEFGRLVVRNPAPTALVPGAPSPWQGEPSSRFTGEVLVRLSPRSPTPLPSVGADERLVSFRAEPAVPVQFFRDSAGNLTALGGVERVVRLTYVLEAPERAFSAPRVPSVGLEQRLEDAPAPVVPAFLNTASEPVLRAIGVSRNLPLDAVLSRTVGYFRAFRDDDLPSPPTASLYTDLALGRVGACRHRAYAFVLTLHALGVPARYVHNEAHAWAEVAIPEVGWTRIDLGGWDVNFRAEAASQREVHLPSNPDPFPRPAEYTNGYSTLANPHGGSQARRGAPSIHPTTDPTRPPNPAGEPGVLGGAEAEPGSAQSAQGPSPNGARGATGNAGGNGPGETIRSGSNGASVGASPDGSTRTSEGPTPTGDSNRNGPEGERPPELSPTTLSLTSVVPEGSAGTAESAFVRGSLVVCSGVARDEARAPVPDLPVEILLVRDGDEFQTLGTTVTRSDGRFDARVLLPVQLRVGSYALRVRTAGDAHHAPATGD